MKNAIKQVFSLILNDEDIKNKIYSNARYIDDVHNFFGEILKCYAITHCKDTSLFYYLLERYQTSYKFTDVKYQLDEELQKEGYNRSLAKFTSIDLLKSLKTSQQQNAFKYGFVTHSFNGAEFRNIQKYGIIGKAPRSNEQAPKNKVWQDVEFLEKTVQESTYLENQLDDQYTQDRFYFCVPSHYTFQYACTQSPERVFYGPLFLPINQKLSIILGETKQQYYKRISKKIIEDKKYSKETKQKVEEAYDNIIQFYCTKRPMVALIDIVNPNYKLKFSTNSTNLYDYLKMNNTQLNNYFPNKHNLGIMDRASYHNISAEHTTFITVPCDFEIATNMAICKGIQKGAHISPITGNQFVKTNTKYSTKHKFNSISKIILNEILIEDLRQKNYTRATLEYGTCPNYKEAVKDAKKSVGQTEQTYQVENYDNNPEDHSL